MKNIRIGNDINVAWSLYRDDAPFPLEGENISLHLQTPYGRIDLEDFSVEGNVISWIFRGKNQKVLGKYSLILFINKGEDGMVATDACDFVNLVDCSCKVGIDDGCGVETEYVNLTSKVDVGGGSSYDDTELRNEIARVDADLTELSTEVSGLSERIDNLPTAESSVFEAVYGKTTYAEIVTAYEENRMIYLNKDNMQYVLQYILPNTIYFVSTYQKYHYQVGCVEAGSWFSQRIDLNNRIEDVDNGNIKVTIDSKTREVATPQYVENAIQQSGGGGTSSDKQGVVKQTQKWTQAADKGYDYVMQNVVRGTIPQANIDLFTSAGAVFNEQSGYFELNGLTDISYEEMRAIYNAGYKMAEGYWANVIRTNIFRPCNVNNVDAAQQYGFTGMYANRNCTAEVFKFTEQDVYGVAIKGQMYGAYDGCIYLKSFGNGVFVGQDSNISDQAFNKCYSLETIYIRSLKKNISFKDSARLSNASILYMIKNSAATSAIVITLHADAKARAEADAEIVAALSEKTNVTLGV